MTQECQFIRNLLHQRYYDALHFLPPLLNIYKENADFNTEVNEAAGNILEKTVRNQRVVGSHLFIYFF